MLTLDFSAYLALTCNRQPGLESSCDPTLRSARSKGGMPHVRAGRTEPRSWRQEQGALGQGILGGFLKEAAFQGHPKDGKGRAANTQGSSSRQRRVCKGCARLEWERGQGYPREELGGCECLGCQVGRDGFPDCGRALGAAVTLAGDDGGFGLGGSTENRAVALQPAEEAKRTELPEDWEWGRDIWVS